MRSCYTALALLVPVALTGCASQETRDAQTDPTTHHAETLQNAYERLAGAQQGLEARLAKLESEQALVAGRLGRDEAARAEAAGELEKLRTQAAAAQTALDALNGKVDRAQESADDAVKIARDGRLVSGKIANSLLLNDNMVLYGYEQPELTESGRAALDKLIADVRPKLPHVFVEIIAYTDSSSLDSQNRRIALERAESVRRYLHETGGIPLDRMSAISYGDAKPLVSNNAFDGRSQNRRVLVQVLK